MKNMDLLYNCQSFSIDIERVKEESRTSISVEWTERTHPVENTLYLGLSNRLSVLQMLRLNSRNAQHWECSVTTKPDY